MITDSLFTLFSGLSIPLWFYPQWLEKFCGYLPFRLTVYEPVCIWLGRYTHCLLYTSRCVYETDIWLGMLKSRNDMTHIYDALAARRLVDMILKQYIPEFQKMEKGIELFYKDEIDNM